MTRIFRHPLLAGGVTKGCIPRAVRFGEFGLAASSLNRSSSSPFPFGEGPRRSECRASILLCLAESKFTKSNGAWYSERLGKGFGAQPFEERVDIPHYR